MKRHILILGAAALFTTLPTIADTLVLLHTNDTHSQLDPDKDGNGGVLQRKALIDSIRSKEKNVLLIDAGDVVQGSNYFKYYKGEVEYPLMDMMGYDIRILGNHEFDNGIDDIAKYYKETKGTPLSANYDFSETELDGVFSPYTIRTVEGRKIGFLGININPEGVVAKGNTGAIKFREIIPAANETAEYLKDVEKCDLVVAVTHIGVKKENDKTTDYELAAASRDIDIIIGGHSHTEIRPGEEGNYPSIVANAEGRPVLVAQTGKYGRNLGYIKIDLDRLGDSRDYDYRLIPVTARFAQDKLDSEIEAFIAPYREQLDSINHRVVAHSARFSNSDDRVGSLPNFTADFAYSYASHIADSLRTVNSDFPEVDFSIMNVGGIRMSMPEGDITEGWVRTSYPFSNNFAIATIKGYDLAEALKVAARKGGEAVSSQLLVVTDSDRNVKEILINGYPLQPDADYTFGSIDFVLGGNDDLVTLANSEILWRDDQSVDGPILQYIERLGKAGVVIDPDSRPRFVTATDSLKP